MFNFKRCPFCGGYMKFESRVELIDSTRTEVSCIKCGMNFSYEQNFLYSNNDRIAINSSFEEIWENRIDNI